MDQNNAMNHESLQWIPAALAAASFDWPAPEGMSIEPRDTTWPEDALITMRDGSHLRGALLGLDLGARSARVAPDDLSTMHPIPFSVIRCLCLHEPVGLRGSSPARPSLLRFRSGDSVRCDVVAQVTRPAGTFIYVADDGDRMLRWFVPAGDFGSCAPCEGGEDRATPRGGQKRPEARIIARYLAKGGLRTEDEVRAALKRYHAMARPRLGEALVQEGILSPAALDSALARQRAGPAMPLGELLVEMGLATPECIQYAFVERLGFPFVALDQFPPDAAIVRRIPAGLAHRLCVVPLFKDGTRMPVAMERPLGSDAMHELEFHAGLRVEIVLASREALENAIAWTYAPPGERA